MNIGDTVDYILEGKVREIKGEFVLVDTEVGTLYLPKKRLIVYEQKT